MRFLKFALIVFVLCFSTVALTQETERIAVLDFENRSSAGIKYPKKAADLMTNELTRSNLFTVVERQRIDAVMREQNFHHSGNVDPMTAAKLGRLLGANVVIIGVIEKLGTGRQTTNVGDSTITRFNSQADVHIRAVDVQTGAIIFSDSEESSAGSKTASVPGFDMGGTAPSVDGPLKASIQKLARKFTDRMRSSGGRTTKGLSAL